MRKYALLAAAAGLAMTGSLAKADFAVQTMRTTTATGMFAGDDAVTLQVKNTGANGTGNNLQGVIVNVHSFASGGSDPNTAKFFIRTFDSDGTGSHNGGDPSTDPTDNDADLSWQGGESQGGSYVRFGSASKWFLASSTPDFSSKTDPGTHPGPAGQGAPGNDYPSSGNYSDGQAITKGFQVVGVNLAGPTGAPDTNFSTVAVAVVPHGQPVQFDGSLASETTPIDTPIAFSVQDPSGPPVPEPASLGLIGLAGLGLLRRRRA